MGRNPSTSTFPNERVHECPVRWHSLRSVDQVESIQNLIGRYNDIAEAFPSEIADEKALPYFVDWLRNKTQLVEITAYADADAYTIFETMNDRGLSLSNTDMLKGYLLASITDTPNGLRPTRKSSSGCDLRQARQRARHQGERS